jgi:glycosyltransferase involved in cell wall biosynthesis
MIKQEKPLVSVIMPVYNGDFFLRKAIDSILTQTFQNFEFIIIDDGSTDQTPKILSSYNDSRLKIITQKNIGLTKSLNRGLNIARGVYIARMDADDVSLPTRLEEEMQLMLSNRKTDLVWTNTVYIDSDCNEICERYQPSLEYTLEKLSNKQRIENHIVHPTVVFKKKTVINLDGYNDRYLTGQDTDLWRRMIERGCKFAYIEKPLLKYRVWPNSRTIEKQGFNDINYTLALLCLKSRQPKHSWQYIARVQSWRLQIYLLIRLFMGEGMIQYFKFIKKYDHKKWHQLG